MDVTAIIKKYTVEGKGILLKCYFRGTGTEDDPYEPVLFDRYSGSILRIVSLNTAKKIGLVCLDASRASKKELTEIRKRIDESIISVLGEL